MAVDVGFVVDDNVSSSQDGQHSRPAINSAILGEVVWLMTQSELHKVWPIASVVQWIIPALLYGQYRLYRNGDKPVGYVSWGRLSSEIETRYVKSPASLQPKDWKSGDRLWLLDWIAPNGGTRAIAKDLKNNLFPNDVARALRWKHGSDNMNIFYLHGKNALSLARDHAENPAVNLK